MSEETPLTLRGFRGLNKRSPAYFLAPDELAECVNFDIGISGEITRRQGWNQDFSGAGGGIFGNQSVKMLGQYIRTGATSVLFVTTGLKVFYTSDGSNYTELLLGGSAISGAVWGVQYLNHFYIIRSNSTIIDYDGTTTAAIAGSPSGDMAVIHKFRMFIFNSSASGTLGSRLYYTDVITGSTITAGLWVADNFINVQEGDGDVLTAMAVLQDSLLLFKMNRVEALYVQGTEADWVLRNVNPALGCTSKYTTREIEGTIFFLSVRGVFRTDGNSFDELSAPISPVFQNRLVSPNTIHQDSAAWWEDKYILCYALPPMQGVTWGSRASEDWDDWGAFTWGGSTSERQYWVYHLRANAWTQWDLSESGMTPHTFTEVRNENPYKGLFAGDSANGGRVYKQDGSIYFDRVSPTVYEFKSWAATKEFDFDAPDNFKRMKWTSLHYQGNGDLSLEYFIDKVSRGEIIVDAPYYHAIHKFAGPGYFKLFQAVFAIYTNQPASFHSFTMHLHMKRTIIQSGAAPS